MRQVFHDQLSGVNERLAQMCWKSSVAIRQATSALLDADLAVAEQVLADGVVIDRDRNEIDEQVIEVIEVIALQSPVAAELRMVLTGMRINADIERMGHLVVHVAKVARMRYPEHAVPESLRDTFAEMGRIAEAIGTKASEVMRTRELAVAEQLGEDDDQMDQLHTGHCSPCCSTRPPRPFTSGRLRPPWVSRCSGATTSASLITRSRSPPMSSSRSPA